MVYEKLAAMLGSYIFKRVVKTIVTIFIVLTLTFFIIRLMPGNPIDIYINNLITTTGISYEEARNQALALFSIDLDKPLYLQYIDYINNLFRGDLGKSIVTIGVPVVDIVFEFLPWTVFTVGFSLLVSFTLGIVCGMIMAYRRGGIFDNVLSALSSILSAIPNFLIGIIFLTVLGVYTRIIPIEAMRGAISPYVKPGLTLEFFSDVLFHAAMPIATYIVTTFGAWALLMKNSTLSTLGEDYVMAAKGRGLPESRITYSYVGRNAILPLFTNLAISIGFIFGGSVLIESVYLYRGIGLRLVEAINSRDYPVMQGIFLIVTAVVILSNFLADTLYSKLDPRVRVGGGG